MANDFSVDEWMLALQEAQQDDEGVTVEELSDKMGYGNRRIRQMIRKLEKSGVKVIVGNKASKRIDGTPYHVPCYKFVKEPS